MFEELITSGRMNPGVDPYLHIWHWPIPVYLFLGGLAAGILFFASLYQIMGKENVYRSAVKIAPIIVPFAIILGLMALIYDLKHKLYFWQLLTTIRLESPMSWGAWVLTLTTPVSMLWVASYLKDIAPRIDLQHRRFGGLLRMVFRTESPGEPVNWNWRYNWMRNFERYVVKNRTALAWVQIVLAVILGVYTGILLSAFNARPLWNTSILGPLFLVSGMSTGAATIMWLSKSQVERKLFSRIDLLLIMIELFFITHLIMGFLAGPQVQIESAQLFLGGEFTIAFWVFVVGLGLLLPAILEIMELSGYHVPIAIPATLILVGGLIFRFVMVEAGQITRYLY